jgi:hypothetical protein
MIKGFTTTIEQCHFMHKWAEDPDKPTIRDHFIMAAMHLRGEPSIYIGQEATERSLRSWADDVCQIADAMLDARNGK